MKFKLKYFIRGFGVGIMFTAIVMSISLQASRSRIIRENALSKEEIMEKAGTYGMVLAKEDSEKVSESEKEEEKLEQSEQEQQSEQDVTLSEDDTKTQDVASVEQEKEEDKDAASGEKEDKKDSNSIVSIDYLPITVTSGMTATSVSTYLKKEGIVEDSDEFRVYLTEQGYASKIRTGEYLIPVNSTYKKIADIITRKNMQ